MKLHIIGTVNGITNEGMRNVATHLSRGFEKHHNLRHSRLKALGAVVKNSLWADATFVFARANPQLYWLLRAVQKLCKNLWLVSVQRPTDGFSRLNNKNPLRCNWLYLTESDIAQVRLCPGKQAYPFQPGLDTEKFCPVDSALQAELKQKYGFDPSLPLIVHVGHCSAGRGLDTFYALDGAKYQRLVVASGLFEDTATVEGLEARNVRIHRGYLEQVQHIYQMADLYLFPTQSNEYVISVPLSVMEALACGTPVIGYESFPSLRGFARCPEDVSLIDSADALPAAADGLLPRKRQECLLRDPKSWDKVAQELLDIITASP